jgi:hypothetical protein
MRAASITEMPGGETSPAVSANRLSGKLVATNFFDDPCSALLSFLTSTLRSAKTAHPLAFLVYGSLSLPKVVEADVLALAGDIYLDSEIRSEVIARTEDQLGSRLSM